MRGVMLANEVLDALPVQRFVVRAACTLRELGVGLEGRRRLRVAESRRTAGASLDAPLLASSARRLHLGSLSAR